METELHVVSLIITLKVAILEFISEITKDCNPVLNPFVLLSSLLSFSQCQGQFCRGGKYKKTVTLQEIMGRSEPRLCFGYILGISRIREGLPKRSVCGSFTCRSFKVLAPEMNSLVYPTSSRGLQTPLRWGSDTAMISALKMTLPIIFLSEKHHSWLVIIYVCFLQASGDRVDLTIARPGKSQPGNPVQDAGAQGSSQHHAQPLYHNRPSSHKVRPRVCMFSFICPQGIPVTNW